MTGGDVPVGEVPQQELVIKHADLVKRIAYHLVSRMPPNVEVDDLIQSGMIGLLDAAKHYSATKGANFETYAGIRIRGAMLDEVRKSDWTPRSVHRNMREMADVVRKIENVKGYLEDGMLGWSQAGYEIATLPQITVNELDDLRQSESNLQIIDVRRPPEYQSGHVPGAVASPLTNLKERAASLGLDFSKTTAVICAGGYRSSAATSILQQLGFSNLLNVTGGTSAWINAGYPVETV